MKRLLVLFSLAALLAPVAVAGPGHGKDKLTKEQRAAKRAERKKALAVKLGISESEVEAVFETLKPVREKQKALRKDARAIREKLKNVDSMSGAEVDALVEQKFNLEQKRLDLARERYQLLRTRLTPAQAAKMEKTMHKMMKKRKGKHKRRGAKADAATE